MSKKTKKLRRLNAQRYEKQIAKEMRRKMMQPSCDCETPIPKEIRTLDKYLMGEKDFPLTVLDCGNCSCRVWAYKVPFSSNLNQIWHHTKKIRHKDD